MDLMPNVHFSKDELIFEEGYPADAVYLVCDGQVTVFKKRNNEQVPLAKLEKDSIFGEMAFISERPRSATVMSTGDTWCYSLSKESFNKRLEGTDPLIVNIFEDLTDTIRKKSENSVFVIDHGEVSALDELELNDNELTKITPEYTYEYLTDDPKIKQKVENMDVFMRKLYSSLVNIAFK